MARSFRYYEKKRGHRRTCSRTVGSLGEAVFSAISLLLGLVGLAAWFVWLVVPEWRVNHEFVEHECTVLDKRITERQGEDGVLYRPEVRIAYRVLGEDYYAWTYDIGTAQDASNSYSPGREDKQQIIDAFVIDPRRPQQYRCWFDPADPGVVVLVRGYRWWIWLVSFVPTSFLLIGLGGLLHAVLNWGRSVERRAALVQRAQDLDLFKTNGHTQSRLPAIPDAVDLTNSPGTTLKFRLPVATSPAWALLGTLLLATVWNGIVAVFAVIAVRAHLSGDPDWGVTLFTLPFLVAGIALIVLFIRQLLMTTGVGPTLVEISAYPLHPGETCQLHLLQSGRLKISRFEVTLVCEEQATFRQGTNTRTEVREVCRQPVLRRDGFEIQHGLPFEALSDLQMPPTAMHSFKADHNEVSWKLVVHGEVTGWPGFDRRFPIIVHPPRARQH